MLVFSIFDQILPENKIRRYFHILGDFKSCVLVGTLVSVETTGGGYSQRRDI